MSAPTMDAGMAVAADARWILVGACDDVPVREGRVVRIDEREIAIFNLGDRFSAVDNRCPHKGGPLGDGIVAGGSVVCPLHAWRVNLSTGAIDRPCESAIRVQTYSVRIDGDRLFVAVPITSVVPEAYPV